MSAETLRRAAAKMREDYPPDQAGSAFYVDVANMLEGAADAWEHEPHPGLTLANELAIARTYLGEA